MEKNNTTFKHPGDLDSEIWEWLKEHGTEETKQIIMMTARHFAGFKEQPDPRHSLIEFIKWSCDRGSITPEQRKNVDFWLAYLEKKKEQKPESCDCSRDEESYTNGIHHVLMNPEAYGLIKQKPAEQLDGTFTSYDMAKTFTEGQNYVIAHPEKFGLCKPAEWKEEDEGMLNCIIATLCEESHGGRESNDKMVTWLENRLKSLHPQPHWKPNEYTLSLVKKVAGGEMLTGVEQMAMGTLHEQLKKL